ncbi:MAG: hypothetical protein WCF24_01730 [Acidimicrobiales bacterium]
MSTLWTPEGEHRVSEQTADDADRRPPGEERAETPADEADVEALREELLAAPVEDIIANHCFGLFELAALHLGASAPNLEKARLAIDALGGVVDTVGDRLGAHSETLKDALSSIRLAFVEISKPRDGEAVEAPNDSDRSAT